jgi:hypothetical protein
MSKLLCSAALLALLSAPADSQDKKERGKTAELTRKFTDFMKENGKEFKGIKDDIEKDKPEADIKKRLAAIRETMAKAKALEYRKNEEEEEKLQGLFDVFEIKIRQDFEGVSWENKEKRLYLLERLQAKCDVCHEIYRD